MTRVHAVVDSCIWISAFLSSDLHHRPCLAFVDEVLRGRHRVCVPDIVLTETVCRFAKLLSQNRRDPADAIRLGERLVQIPSIRWIEMDHEFCSGAAAFGAVHGLRGMDALVAFAAKSNRCELVTNDRDFLDSSVRRLIKMRTLV